MVKGWGFWVSGLGSRDEGSSPILPEGCAPVGLKYRRLITCPANMAYIRQLWSWHIQDAEGQNAKRETLNTGP